MHNDVVSPPAGPLPIDIKILKGSLIESINCIDGGITVHPELKPEGQDQHVYQFSLLPTSQPDVFILLYNRFKY